MFMMLLGIFWFGQAFSIYGAITRAAQEGARAGAAPYLRDLHRGNTLPICTTLSTAVKPLWSRPNSIPPRHTRRPSTPVFTCLQHGGIASCARRRCQRKFVHASPVQLSQLATGAPGSAAFPSRFNIRSSSGCPLLR